MSEFNSKSCISSSKQRGVVSSEAYSSSVSNRVRDATPSTISTKGTSTTISSTPDTAHGIYSTCNQYQHQHQHQTEIETETETENRNENDNLMFFADGQHGINNHVNSCSLFEQKDKQNHKLQPKDASDILAQWRRERHEHQKLRDKENLPNIQIRVDDGNAHDRINDDGMKNNSASTYQTFEGTSKVSSSATLRAKSPEHTSSNDDHANANANTHANTHAHAHAHTHTDGQRMQSSRKLHLVKVPSQTPVGHVRQQHASSVETGDDEGLEGVDTSVVTTPTGNTALNSVGMERLYNNRNQSAGVRLFPASQEEFKPLNRLVYHDKMVVDHQNNKRVQRKGQELRFQPIGNAEFHGGEGDSIDVSLMTQDTDMIFLEDAIRDADRQTEEVSNNTTQTLNHKDEKLLSHKYSRELPYQSRSRTQPPLKNTTNNNADNSNSNHHTANASSSTDGDYAINTSTNQNDVAKILSTLQSSLEQSRIIRSGQEKELIQNKDIIAQLKQQKQIVIKETHDYRNILRNSIGELMQHVNGLQDCLSFDGDNQHGERSERDLKGIEGNTDETRILREISDVMKQLVDNKMPHLLEQLHENTNKVQAAKAELKKVCSQVRKAKQHEEEQTRQNEEKWTLRKQQINQEHIHVQSKIQTEQKKLEIIQNNLAHSDQVSAHLRDTQQKLDQQKTTLSNITAQVLGKREELADIEKLCEERIQSAHSIENNAQETVKEARNEKKTAAKLHDAAVKKFDAIKSIEKAAKLEREDLDNNRLAWGTELSLKHDQMAIEVEHLDEERQKLKGIEESLELQRSQLKEENDRVTSVQNQLLEVEAVTEEKLLILDEKEAGIKKREDDICKSEDQIAERRKNLDLQLEEHVKRSNELLSIETDWNNRLLSLQQDRDEFREEQQQYLERLTALEQRETELEVDRNELTVKASKLSTTVKSAKEDTEKRRQQLDQFDSQLCEKEKTLAQQSRVIALQENEVTEHLKELEAKKEKMTNDSLKLERTLKGEKAEHEKLLALTVSNQVEEETRLKNITQKKIETENSYKKLCSDVIQVKEALQNKVNDAQTEFQGLDNTVAIKKNELVGLQEMAQNVCEEVDESNKAKNEISDSIRLKENILLKVEAKLQSGKEAWDRAKHEKEKEMEIMINAKRQEAEKQFFIMREKAVSKMMKISNDLSFKQEEASCKLSSRARQIDLLHSKLSKVTRRTLVEQKQAQEDRRVWEDKMSRLKNDLEENLELIRHKDGEISSYLQANTALKASLDSVTAHEVLLTGSLQAKDKEMHLIVQDKRALELRVTDYERQLSTLRCSTTKLEKVYEEKISSLKLTAERDTKIVITRNDKDKRVLDQKLTDYERQLSSLKSSTAELEKACEEKISSLKLTAERDMKLATTRHDTDVVSLGKIDVRMKELLGNERRLEKEREDLMKRSDALQKSEECINSRIIDIERKESKLEGEAKEIHHSKLLLQEERQLMHTRVESLKQKENKIHEQSLEFYARQEACQKETRKESSKLDESRQIIDEKQKLISEKEESLERKTVELKTWERKLSDSSMNSDKKVAVVQSNLLKQEKELQAAKTELSDRLKSIKELEEDMNSRTAFTKRQEDAITLKLNKMSEKLSIEQEHVTQAQQSLKEEKQISSARLKELKAKEDEMNSRFEEIKIQQTNNAETKKRLREFAQSLKKQGKDIRSQEKNIQNTTKLLKEQQTQTVSSDATLIAELQTTVTLERKQYQELVDIHTKQKAVLRTKEEELDQIQNERANIGASEESQQRMRQIALQLKQKDEELLKREEDLEERILKCDECESTLAAWNMKLDGMAATFDSTPENNIYRRQHP